MAFNPILKLDYPDPDVIRVEDTYYMVSTTMHFMPGGVILRSYDLIHWEIASYVFDTHEDTPAARLADGKGVYGQGMWAASLRHHKGVFYVCFVANDTHKTYLYHAEKIEGPWTKQYIEGFYHDCSLLFDDDDRTYIVYGNTDIYLTELKEDLSGPKKGGLSRLLVSDNRSKVYLGYEGSHLYKINGKYYLFLIHWPNHGTCRRTEACFFSDSLDGTFIGRDVVDDDIDYFNSGVAQGGIVDTPDGHWYAMLFQDYGALGRIPVLSPVTFVNNFPVFGHPTRRAGKIPKKIKATSTRPGYRYAPLFGGDDFNYARTADGNIHLKAFWQWNHVPEDHLWDIGMAQIPSGLLSTQAAIAAGEDTAPLPAPATYHRVHCYQVTTGKLCSNLTQAVNTLTQRLVGNTSSVSVTVDGSHLNNGDFAGLAALQGCYAFIALTKEDGNYYIVVHERNRAAKPMPDGEKENYDSTETVRVPVDSPFATLRLTACFGDMKDTVTFSYRTLKNDTVLDFVALGDPHKLYFTLDHFTGCRAGLFAYSTKETGGSASFADFSFDVEE